jgi:NADPH2:quinone reductase
LGTNIAGTVERLGSQASSEFHVGDRVFGLGNTLAPTPEQSGLQQYAILASDTVAKIPDGMSFEDAVGVPVNATTSAAAIWNPKGFGFAAPFPAPDPEAGGPGTDVESNTSKSIVIVGAGSHVGKIAIQWARLSGVGRIIAIASSKNEEHLKDIGATHVIDRHQDPTSIASTLRSILDDENDGALYVYDCVSWDFTMTVSLMSRNNPKAVLLILHKDEKPQIMMKEQGIPARATWVLGGNGDFLQPLTAEFWKILPEWLAKGQVLIPRWRAVDGLENLDVIEEALDSYRDGQSVVPLIVRPNN